MRKSEGKALIGEVGTFCEQTEHHSATDTLHTHLCFIPIQRHIPEAPRSEKSSTYVADLLLGPLQPLQLRSVRHDTEAPPFAFFKISFVLDLKRKRKIHMCVYMCVCMYAYTHSHTDRKSK